MDDNLSGKTNGLSRRLTDMVKEIKVKLGVYGFKKLYPVKEDGNESFPDLIKGRGCLRYSNKSHVFINKCMHDLGWRVVYENI